MLRPHRSDWPNGRVEFLSPGRTAAPLSDARYQDLPLFQADNQLLQYSKALWTCTHYEKYFPRSRGARRASRMPSR